LWEKLVVQETASSIKVGIAFTGVVAFGIALGQVLVVIVDAVSAEHRIKPILCIGQRGGFQLGWACSGFQQI
jgi:hypothetical protein